MSLSTAAPFIKMAHATHFNLDLLLLSSLQFPNADPANSESVGRHAEHSVLPGNSGVCHQPGNGQDTGSQARLRRESQPGRKRNGVSLEPQIYVSIPFFFFINTALRCSCTGNVGAWLQQFPWVLL